MSITEKKRFDLKEAARRIGVSETSLRRKAKRGEVSFYRPHENGKFYFNEVDLQDFEERRTFQAKINCK